MNLNFNNPNILFGLIALLIPVIIHLFNFKRFKLVYFSNLRMLKEVTQQSKKQSKLRHMLVLFSRILALFFLVFAFAKPFIPAKINGGNKSQSKKVAVFLDNSFSMEQQGKRGVVFDQAANYAREISRVYKNTDRFKLLTGNNLGVPGFYSRDEFDSETHRSKIAGISVPFSEVINGLVETIEEEKADEVFVVSDFQQNVTDFSKWANDTTTVVYLVPVESSTAENIYMDSCWFEEPVLISGESLELHFRLSKNFEGQSGDIPVKLSVDDKPKTALTVSFDGKSQDFAMKFNLTGGGDFNAKIEISDYPVTYDDKLFFSFTIKQKIELLVINGPRSEANLMKYLSSDSTFVVSEMPYDGIDFSSFSKVSNLVLNGLESLSTGLVTELKKFVETGGKLIIIPSSNPSIADYNLLNQAIGIPLYTYIDTSKIFLSGLDNESREYSDIFEEYKENINWPFVGARLISKEINSKFAKPLIFLRDNSPFLFSARFGDGLIYYFTGAFNSSVSNLTRHAIFVPVFYKLAIVESYKMPLYQVIGKDSKILTKPMSIKNDEAMVLRKKGSTESFIPRWKTLGSKMVIDVEGIGFEEGAYEIMVQDSLVGLVSFNYNRVESELKTYKATELENQVEKLGLKNVIVVGESEKGISERINEANDGKQLWKLFLGLALAFLLIEVLLLRFLK